MTDRELEELLRQTTPQLRDAWLSTLPTRENLPEYPTSQRFQKRVARLVQRAGRSHWANSALRHARQAAVIALVMVTVSFSGLMITSQAFRQQVIAAVMQVFEEITEFRFRYDPSYTTERTPGDFVLTYLPENMVEVGRDEGPVTFFVFYESSEGDYLDVEQHILTEKSAHSYGLDTEDAEIEYFTIRNSQAMAVSKKGEQTILWSEGNTTFILGGTIPMETLKQVAFGLK